MKKNLFFLFFIFLIFSCFQLKSNPVDSTRACAIATHFYHSLSSAQNQGAAPMIVYTATASTQRDSRTPCYYVVNMGAEGYVIVAADDCAQPILGYSTESAFDASNIPVGLQDMLDGYRNEIQHAIMDNVMASEEISAQWFEVSEPSRRSRTVVVSPMIQTTWNQYPVYNSMCPIYTYPGTSTTVQAVTGCVATATAQILRYWEWPVQGVGSHSYHAYSMDNTAVDLGVLSANFGNTIYLYDLMPTSVSSSTNSLMRTQVARLSYHCGVAVDMMYSCNGSGAYSEDLPEAFRNYFDYQCDGMRYMSQYSLSQWRNMLKAELDLGHPMSYSGSSSEGGHAFICDGYDDNNYFHFNFGWGGSGNGFFTVSGTGVHEYSSNQDAIFGIEPNRPVCDGETCHITIDISNNTNGNGWNGGYMVVYQGDKAIKGVVLQPSRSSDSYTFNVCEDSLHFHWFPGSNDAVCSFTIYNSDNEELYTVNGNPPTGRFFSVNYACSECPYPINLTTSQIEEREATISWTSGGSPMSYTIEYGEEGFAHGEGTIIENVSSPYTLTSLQAEHTYDVYVRANCSDSVSSGWSSVCTFTTLIRCNNDNNIIANTTAGNSGTRYIPIDFSGSYRYSYSQQLFTRADLNSMGVRAGKINSVSFQTYQLSAQTLNNVSVYVGHADMDSFIFAYLPISDMTLVYSGSMSIRSGNRVWNELEFQTPFVYDGSHSLVIAVLNNSGTTVSTTGSQGSFLCHDASTRKCLLSESTSSIDPATLSAPDYYIPATRNNMKFNVCLAGYACDDIYSTLDSTVCENDFPFVWNGVTFEDEGVDSAIVTYNGGCDSIVTMIVHKAFTTVGEDVYVTNCGDFDWYGHTYTTSGDYNCALVGSNGCDSNVLLHLTIHPAYDEHDYLGLCEDDLPYTYELEDTVFDVGTISGDYTFFHRTQLNCDSIMTLHLSIGRNTSDTIHVSHCGPYTWNGQTYAQSGYYTESFTSQYGCDSVVTLDLTINPIPDVTISGNLSIHRGDTTTLTASGADTYLWSNGSRENSISVSPFNSTTYRVTGTTSAGCTATSSVTVQVSTGVEEIILNNDVTVYPNPAAQKLFVDFAPQADIRNTEIHLLDMYGRLVLSAKVTTHQTEVNLLNLSSGIYMLKWTGNNQTLFSTKVVIQ